MSHIASKCDVLSCAICANGESETDPVKTRLICVWRVNGRWAWTDCGNKRVDIFTTHSMNFCPFCGAALEIMKNAGAGI